MAQPIQNLKFAVGNEIIFNRKVLKCNPCNFNDANNLVGCGSIILRRNASIQESRKHCIPLDNSKDLDLAMPVYSLLEILWSGSKFIFFSKDEATNFDAHIANSNNFKSFKYKAKLLGDTDSDEANRILRSATISVPLSI